MNLQSAIDSERFGMAIGKVTLASRPEAEAALQAARAQRLDLLIARTRAEHLDVVHVLEDAGSRLMDSLLYYRRPLDAALPPAPSFVRAGTPGDADAVEAVAREAFRDYPSHYRRDPRLPVETTEKIYPDWARRSVTHQPAVADRVLVAELDGQVAGFATLNFLEDEVADGTLFAVSPASQGRGLYRALLQAAMAAARQHGCRTMEYSTQLTNVRAQRTITQLGFGLDRAVYTFHRWYN